MPPPLSQSEHDRLGDIAARYKNPNKQNPLGIERFGGYASGMANPAREKARTLLGVLNLDQSPTAPVQPLAAPVGTLHRSVAPRPAQPSTARPAPHTAPRQPAQNPTIEWITSARSAVGEWWSNWVQVEQFTEEQATAYGLERATLMDTYRRHVGNASITLHLPEAQVGSTPNHSYGILSARVWGAQNSLFLAVSDNSAVRGAQRNILAADFGLQGTSLISTTVPDSALREVQQLALRAKSQRKQVICIYGRDDAEAEQQSLEAAVVRRLKAESMGSLNALIKFVGVSAQGLREHPRRSVLEALMVAEGKSLISSEREPSGLVVHFAKQDTFLDTQGKSVTSKIREKRAPAQALP